MTSVIKHWIRPRALPLLHRWQRFFNICKAEWREFHLRDAWIGLWQRHRALKNAAPVIEDLYGIRFVLYPFDRRRLLELLRRKHDRAEFCAIPKLVKAGDTVFDVGANMGAYSVLLSRSCGPSGHVWSFEPVPATYWRLCETLVLNRCENVSPVRAAVSSRSGIVEMNLFDNHQSEWSSLGRPSITLSSGDRISPHKSVPVESLTLDEFCYSRRIERIHFLKVDVEGFELSVFHGAQRLLKEHFIDYICFEISKEPLEGAGVTSRSVFEALADHGYLIYRLDETSGKFIGPVNESSTPWTNFFASWKVMSSA